MTRRTLVTTLALGAALGLAACSEKPQVGAHPVKKGDAAAYQGPQGAPAAAYAAPGWTAGDATSWQTQIRTRNQGQNEYNRSPAAPVGQ